MSSRFEQSVKARLKNIANKAGRDFNFVSIQYLQERFQARLEKSAYRDHFILKGHRKLFRRGNLNFHFKAWKNPSM